VTTDFTGMGTDPRPGAPSSSRKPDEDEIRPVAGCAQDDILTKLVAENMALRHALCKITNDLTRRASPAERTGRPDAAG